MQTRSSPSIKAELFSVLKRHHDLKRLERARIRSKRRKVAYAEHSDHFLRKKIRSATNRDEKEQGNFNSLDPIMLTDLGKHTFDFKRPNGTTVRYNIDSLVRYILSTGDFAEPESRIAFSDTQLKNLDTAAKRAGFCMGSVLSAKRNKQRYIDVKVKRDGALGLERCAGECVVKMLRVVENSDPEDGEMKLLMDIFPAYSDLYQQLFAVDCEYALQCTTQFIEFIRGPPNKPTVDQCGLLQVVLKFLHDANDGQLSRSDFGF